MVLYEMQSVTLTLTQNRKPHPRPILSSLLFKMSGEAKNEGYAVPETAFCCAEVRRNTFGCGHVKIYTWAFCFGQLIKFEEKHTDSGKCHHARHSADVNNHIVKVATISRSVQ